MNIYREDYILYKYEGKLIDMAMFCMYRKYYLGRLIHDAYDYCVNMTALERVTLEIVTPR